MLKEIIRSQVKVTQTELAKIVAQASSLSEAINNQLFKLDATQFIEQKDSDERLSHWCEVVAQGDWEKFRKRLQWDGWNTDAVYAVLGGQPRLNSQVLPKWAETLREIIQTGSYFTFQDKIKLSSLLNQNLNSQLPIDPQNPLPFEEVMLPALSVARQKLLTLLEVSSLSPDWLPLEILSEKAYLTLERSLLQKLVNLCEKTLAHEFSCFRPLGYNLLNLMIGETQGSKNKAQYSAFVREILQDGLLSFYQKYSVLGRLVTTAINFWVEITAEFLQRLKADIAEIHQLYNYPAELGKVSEIKPFLSDAHNGGRSVISFSFESGVRLVYKPKNLDLEVAYNQLLDWCNNQVRNSSLSFFLSGESNGHNILPFKVLKIISRQNYGWVEYIEHLPCQDEAETQRFYLRSGILLCLLYVLRGTDCHHENLIANGEYPMLVDIETLMHHQEKTMIDPWSAIKAESTVYKLFSNSVLRTALLPYWDFHKEYNIAFDLSGLGSTNPQQIPRYSPRMRSINTDDMHLDYEIVTKLVQNNVCILNGIVLSPNNYLKDLVEGFQQMYRFLMEQQNTLLESDGPLTAFKGKQVRFISRSTFDYGIVLQNTLAPDFLRNGVDRSIELDILSREFLSAQDKPNAWSIFQAEVRAMEQLDFPYFAALSDSDALTVGLEQAIEQYFIEPSYSQVLKRMQQLNEIDLAQQVEIIHGAFYAMVARTPSSTEKFFESNQESINFSHISPLSQEQLRQEANKIAQEIQERAMVSGDGCINWMGLSYIPNAERYQFQPLDESLYNGNCGVALFLAALDYLRGSSQFRNLTLSALQYTCKVLQSNNKDLTQRFARNIGIGGANGLGSIMYSLVKISYFLKEPALIEDAQGFANLITPELIAADQQFDVIGGAAGAILGLLALYHKTYEQTVLDKAIACGQHLLEHHLLEHRISINGSPKAWKSFEDKPLTGFSHGATGIAYALLRLYSVTQDSGLSIFGTDEIHQDVAMVLQTTQKFDLQGTDHFYGGNLGCCELLLLEAKKLSRPELLKIAQQRASWVVARAKQAGGYQLFANLPNHVFNPSFFQGTAGIGYELLRLAHPEALPSVLLWE